MKKKDYNKFLKSISNPGEVFQVCRDLDLKISKRQRKKLNKGSWTRHVKDNFKKVKKQNPRAGMKTIMKTLSKEFNK